MSKMGQMVFQVQEDTNEMLAQGMSPSKVEDVVSEMYGEMFRETVKDTVLEMNGEDLDMRNK